MALLNMKTHDYIISRLLFIITSLEMERILLASLVAANQILFSFHTNS